MVIDALFFQYLHTCMTSHLAFFSAKSCSLKTTSDTKKQTVLINFLYNQIISSDHLYIYIYGQIGGFRIYIQLMNFKNRRTRSLMLSVHF